jgi:hypothetical protein
MKKASRKPKEISFPKERLTWLHILSKGKANLASHPFQRKG